MKKSFWDTISNYNRFQILVIVIIILIVILYKIGESIFTH